MVATTSSASHIYDIPNRLLALSVSRFHERQNRSAVSDRVNICAIETRDRIAQRHVRALLASEGIPVGFYGSLSYGVSVPKPRAEFARSLIERDAKKYGFWLSSAGRVIESAKEDIQWENRAILMSRIELRKSRADLPHVMRAVLAKSWFVQTAKQLPIIRSIRWRLRRYLDIVVTDARHFDITERRGFDVQDRQGYDVELTLAPNSQLSDGTTYTYQVLSDGSAWYSGQFPIADRESGN